jgi:GGDEF domain-containing protein
MSPVAPPAEQARRLSRLMLRRAPRTSLAAALALIVLVGIADYLSGPEISLAVFYILPVAVATWWGGRRSGVAVALACGAVWTGAEITTRHYSHPAIGYWNATVRTSTWLMIAVLLAEVRASADREADRRRTGGSRGDPRNEPFYRAVEREHARLGDGGAPFTLVYLDLSGLHDGGTPTAQDEDEPVIARVRSVLRRGDRVASPRGREVALLLCDTEPEAAAIALERICAALRALAAEAGRPEASGVVGAVTCTASAGDLNAVLQRAYQQMYVLPRTPGQVALSHATMAGSDILAGAA